MDETTRRHIELDERFTTFVNRLVDRGYEFRGIDRTPVDLGKRYAYLRHDVSPIDLDIDVALRLAAIHRRLRLPGSIHLAWDAIEQDPRLRDSALRLSQVDPDHIRLGLMCDPISGWLARSRFASDIARLNDFVRSPDFGKFLDDLYAAWRADGENAARLRALRNGAWEYLCGVDRSFHAGFGRSAAISGRGLLLSNVFFNARRMRPELSVLDPWLNPITFLATSDLAVLGYEFEATSFPPDDHPGPSILFGGVDPAALCASLNERVSGGTGFVAIFPARYWDGDRYETLLGPAAESTTPAAIPAATSAPAGCLPDRPVLTNMADLEPFGPRCERVDTRQLAVAARQKIGGGVDLSFRAFVEWLRSEGYEFAGFEDGPPRFSERRAYLRYDVHTQDLFAAYILADLHERLGVVGSFQITWMYSRYEEAFSPYFEKLLQFDRRFVQFGLHAAPTATWYLTEKLGGDENRQHAAMADNHFAEWLCAIHAAYLRDGDDAPELQEIRAGTDAVLSRIAASFHAAFGPWKSISGHGNFLTAGFLRAQRKHPEIEVLYPYFSPVAYMEKYGVARFGFDYEVTAFGVDRVPFPRVMMEGAPEETRRRWYRGRVANGVGFIALLHPASWTYRHNATFFLPDGTAAPPVSEPQKILTPSPSLPSVIARLHAIVQDNLTARGEDPKAELIEGNIEYNSTHSGRRAGTIAAFLQRAYGFSMRGKAVCEFGSGFGGLCLHWALEHGAGPVLAVDSVSYHVGALRTLVREFGLPGFTVIEGDLQEFTAFEETMDAVILNDVMYTSELSPDRVAAACARVLRPGGAVLFRNVNRAYGPAVVSHREGTQFLDPASADRAARFIGRGAGSTLAHRPLSPSGLASVLRQAGFDDFRLDGDSDGRYGLPQSSKGLRPIYLLAGRKVSTGARPFRRIALPPDGVLDLAPFRRAVDRETLAVRRGADELQRIFGAALAVETACAELREYLICRLLIDGLKTFRVLPRDRPACDFAAAVDRALDHALVAILSRHADWTSADFAAADPHGLSLVLRHSAGAVRRNFRQPDDRRWAVGVDWQSAASTVMAVMLPGIRSHSGTNTRVALLLRDLVADHLRLEAVGLLARTADPVTGPLAQEYTEAAIERLHGEILDRVAPTDPERNFRPFYQVELLRVVEDIEARLRPSAGAAAPAPAEATIRLPGASRERPA